MKVKELHTIDKVINNEFIKINYFDEEQTISRIKNLSDAFYKKYKEFPDEDVHMVRVPGRTNIIGEHIDYSNCPVFTFAVNKDFLCLFIKSPKPDVEIYSLNIDKTTIFPLNDINELSEKGSWENYIKAGFNGVFKKLQHFDIEKTKGFKAVIHSSMPDNARMSSSSSLVIASAMMLMSVNNIEFDKFQLTLVTAEAENFFGIQGGGLNQASSLLSHHNKALKIDFSPLSITEYPLSEKHCFILTHTKSIIEKNIILEFNRRFIESKLVGAIVGKFFHEKYEEYNLSLIGDLYSLIEIIPLEEIYKIAKKFIDKDYYTLEEIKELIPQSTIDLILNQKNFFEEPKEGFALGLRLEHIFSEWFRVLKSANVIQMGNMEILGQLINESHLSCRDNHQVSCKEADVLSDLARNSGLVLGSRITGTGFGGCVLNLIENEKVNDFISFIKENYYKNYLKIENDDEIENSIFIVKPSDGACYISLEEPS